MKESKSPYEIFSEDEISLIKKIAKEQEYSKDQLVFSEGDNAELFYIILKGSISIYFDDDGTENIANTQQEGGYFGEMGILNVDKRAYSAKSLETSLLLCVSRDSFIKLIKDNPKISMKIKHALSQRNEELILRETLINTTGIDNKKLYVSIKGDPSLRETALFRERYESPVDKIIDQLKINLEELLLNKCVYQLTVNFNSGEIHLYTSFDPFREKIHLAQTLTNQAYINRHFINMEYDDKTKLIKNIYKFISEQPQHKALPEQWKNIFKKTSNNWEPLSKTEISKVMDKLTELRSVPNFYLRSFSINTIQDTIRLQFNCDGTHIVNSADYESFLDENFAF